MTKSNALVSPQRKLQWRTLARTAGIIAVIAGVFPSGVHQGGAVRTDAERDFLIRNPETMPLRSEYTLGCQSSPLIRRFSETTLVTDDAETVSLRRTSGLQVGFLSWSMAGLILGALLLWTARKRPDRGERSQYGAFESAT